MHLLGKALMLNAIVFAWMLSCPVWSQPQAVLPSSCAPWHSLVSLSLSLLQAMRGSLKPSVCPRTWSPVERMKMDSSRTAPLIIAWITFLPSTQIPKSSAGLVSFIIPITAYVITKVLFKYFYLVCIPICARLNEHLTFTKPFYTWIVRIR